MAKIENLKMTVVSRADDGCGPGYILKVAYQTNMLNMWSTVRTEQTHFSRQSLLDEMDAICAAVDTANDDNA